jgi:hypothetical protein
LASSTGPFRNCQFDPGVVEAFRPAFDACEALLRFAAGNRPSRPLTEDAADKLIFRTYARSSKTYNASFLLSGRGYGVQAGMLNRSLFEDMIVAHWIKKNAANASEKYERHRRHAIEETRGALTKHGAGIEMEHLPELSEGQRKSYAQEFGNRSWTGLSLDALTEEVEDEWPEGQFGRDMLWWVYDIVQRFNNLMLHHTAISLGLTSVDPAKEGEENEAVTLDVGPSTAHVQGSLLGAFYCYHQTMTLVLDEEQTEALRALLDEYFPPAFLAIRTEPDGDADPT